MRSGETQYGFVWEQVAVSRIAEFRGRRVVRVGKVTADGVPDYKDSIEVIVSPKGNNIRVYKNGKELL